MRASAPEPGSLRHVGEFHHGMRGVSGKKHDLKILERIVYKSGGDITISIARSFERIEECVDAVESRLYSRLAD